MSLVVPYKKHPCCWVDKVNGNKTLHSAEWYKQKPLWQNISQLSPENFSIFLSTRVSHFGPEYFLIKHFHSPESYLLLLFICVSIWDWFSLWYDHVVEYKKGEIFFFDQLFFIMHSSKPLMLAMIWFCRKNWFYFPLFCFSVLKFNRW